MSLFPYYCTHCIPYQPNQNEQMCFGRDAEVIAAVSSLVWCNRMKPFPPLLSERLIVPRCWRSSAPLLWPTCLDSFWCRSGLFAVAFAGVQRWTSLSWCQSRMFSPLLDEEQSSRAGWSRGLSKLEMRFVPIVDTLWPYMPPHNLVWFNVLVPPYPYLYFY